MANSSSLVSSVLLHLVVVVAICMASTSAASRAELACAGEARGWKVGGRTVIRDVKEDREVQDLGLFAVREHNRRLGPAAGADDRLVFGGVILAERQVVSGIKYYLRIAAISTQEAAGGAAPGAGRRFDAVVVVKAWLDSRELLSFAPSSSNLHFH